MRVRENERCGARRPDHPTPRGAPQSAICHRPFAILHTACPNRTDFSRAGVGRHETTPRLARVGQIISAVITSVRFRVYDLLDVALLGW